MKKYLPGSEFMPHLSNANLYHFTFAARNNHSLPKNTAFMRNTASPNPHRLEDPVLGPLYDTHGYDPENWDYVSVGWRTLPALTLWGKSCDAYLPVDGPEDGRAFRWEDYYPGDVQRQTWLFLKENLEKCVNEAVPLIMQVGNSIINDTDYGDSDIHPCETEADLLGYFEGYEVIIWAFEPGMFTVILNFRFEQEHGIEVVFRDFKLDEQELLDKLR